MPPAGYVRQVSRITHFFFMFNLVLDSINMSFSSTYGEAGGSSRSKTKGINSQSLEDKQVRYISQCYILDKYTLKNTLWEKYTLGGIQFEKICFGKIHFAKTHFGKTHFGKTPWKNTVLENTLSDNTLSENRLRHWSAFLGDVLKSALKVVLFFF